MMARRMVGGRMYDDGLSTPEPDPDTRPATTTVTWRDPEGNGRTDRHRGTVTGLDTTIHDSGHIQVTVTDELGRVSTTVYPAGQWFRVETKLDRYPEDATA